MAEQPTYPHNIDKDYVWWIEDNQIAIAYIKDTVTTAPTGTWPRNRTTQGEFLSPHEVSTIRVHVVKTAGRVGGEGNSDDLSVLTDTPELPEQFHESLVYYAIMKGYERSAEGLENTAYFKAEYERGVQAGNRYTNTRRMNGPRSVTINKTTGIL